MLYLFLYLIPIIALERTLSGATRISSFALDQAPESYVSRAFAHKRMDSGGGLFGLVHFKFEATRESTG
ncbi:MAG: hypothetical protein AAB425_01140, partial [Bdellovibrionota bacterium]